MNIYGRAFREAVIRPRRPKRGRLIMGDVETIVDFVINEAISAVTEARFSASNELQVGDYKAAIYKLRQPGTESGK